MALRHGAVDGGTGALRRPAQPAEVDLDGEVRLAGVGQRIRVTVAAQRLQGLGEGRLGVTVVDHEGAPPSRTRRCASPLAMP